MTDWQTIMMYLTVRGRQASWLWYGKNLGFFSKQCCFTVIIFFVAYCGCRGANLFFLVEYTSLEFFNVMEVVVVVMVVVKVLVVV
jgi:hypothetical protein